MGKRIALKPAEIAAAFDSEDARCLPPILDVVQVAELLGKTEPVIYHWIAMGRFDGTFRKRGKHLFFWRDRVVQQIFNGPEWPPADAAPAKPRHPKRRTDALQGRDEAADQGTPATDGPHDEASAPKAEAVPGDAGDDDPDRTKGNEHERSVEREQ